MNEQEKSFGQIAHDGFVRGMAGGEEHTSQARRQYSPESLPDEMLGIKKLYWAIPVCAVLGFFNRMFWGIGILGAMLLYTLDVCVVDRKLQRLRRAKFCFVPNVDNKLLFSVMQPIFIAKYGMLVDLREDGVVTITHNKYMYDILIQNDGTFVIWWRMSIGRAFMPKNKYTAYKEITATMGIIAYEIQNAIRPGK